MPGLKTFFRLLSATVVVGLLWLHLGPSEEQADTDPLESLGRGNQTQLLLDELNAAGGGEGASSRFQISESDSQSSRSDKPPVVRKTVSSPDLDDISTPHSEKAASFLESSDAASSDASPDAAQASSDAAQEPDTIIDGVGVYSETPLPSTNQALEVGSSEDADTNVGEPATRSEPSTDVYEAPASDAREGHPVAGSEPSSALDADAIEDQIRSVAERSFTSDREVEDVVSRSRDNDENQISSGDQGPLASESTNSVGNDVSDAYTESIAADNAKMESGDSNIMDAVSTPASSDSKTAVRSDDDPGTWHPEGKLDMSSTNPNDPNKPCTLQLPSRVPAPFCQSSLTPCHFRSCPECRESCKTDPWRKEIMDQYRLDYDISQKNNETGFRLGVVVTGPATNPADGNLCEDELLVTVKGPMLTQMYTQGIEGKLVKSMCEYVLGSIPLISGRYYFTVEVRTVRGQAYHMEPSNITTPGFVKDAGLCRLPNQMLEGFLPSDHIWINLKTPKVVDCQIQPGIVSFDVPRGNLFNYDDCQEVMHAGAWFHWSQLKKIKHQFMEGEARVHSFVLNKCADSHTTAFICKDFEPTDDFIWCHISYSDRNQYNTITEFSEKLNERLELPGHDTKILLIGSTGIEQLYAHMASRYMLPRRFKLLRSENFSHYHEIAPGLNLQHLNVSGIYTVGWDNVRCALNTNIGLSTIHRVITHIKEAQPHVIWLEEGLQNLQHMGEHDWLDMLRSYFFEIRKVFHGPVVWRGNYPFMLGPCCARSDSLCAQYSFLTIPRVRKLQEAGRKIAAMHDIHIADIFDLALNRPEIFQDGMHLRAEIPCAGMPPQDALCKDRQFSEGLLNVAKKKAEKKFLPCSKNACHAYHLGCWHDESVKYGSDKMLRLSPTTIAEYLLVAFLHLSIDSGNVSSLAVEANKVRGSPEVQKKVMRERLKYRHMQPILKAPRLRAPSGSANKMCEYASLGACCRYAKRWCRESTLQECKRLPRVVCQQKIGKCLDVQVIRQCIHKKENPCRASNESGSLP